MLEATAYTTGPLNQYTAIERGEEAAFEPVHDCLLYTSCTVATCK